MTSLDLLAGKLGSQIDLGEEAARAIMALPLVRRTLDPLSYIVREGDHPDRCAVLLSGFTYRHKLVEGGARQIVGIQIAGDPLDFQGLFLDVADHSVQTLTRSEVAFILRSDLQRLVAADPAVAMAVTVNIAIEASIHREWIVNIGRRAAPARLAHLLCEMAQRQKALGLIDGDDFVLPMSQEQIGDALGLTSVHVNRTLKGLEAAGLIRRERRFVRLADWAALRDLSGFSARYLHLHNRAVSMRGT